MHNNKTIVSIMVAQEAPKKVRPEYKKPSLYEKVCEYIRRIESGYIDSEREWYYIKKLYERLSRKKHLKQEHEELLDKIEEILEKYGNHDHDDMVDLDAQYMHRYSDKEY